MAADWAGFETAGFAEIGDYPASVLADLWPEIPNYGNVNYICPDEKTLTKEEKKISVRASDIVARHGDIDLLTAGVPCQPASQAGNRRGSADERWLWPDALRILGALRPPFAVFENPPGIKTVEEGTCYQEIQASLAELGYEYWWDVIPAAAVGSGHQRKRVWLTAYSHSSGLERYSGIGVPPAGWKNKGRPSADADLSFRKTSTRETWYRKSPVPVVVDGVSSSTFKDEFTAAGNAIVPQVAYNLLQPIADIIKYRTEN